MKCYTSQVLEYYVLWNFEFIMSHKMSKYYTHNKNVILRQGHNFAQVIQSVRLHSTLHYLNSWCLITRYLFINSALYLISFISLQLVCYLSSMILMFAFTSQLLCILHSLFVSIDFFWLTHTCKLSFTFYFTFICFFLAF